MNRKSGIWLEALKRPNKIPILASAAHFGNPSKDVDAAIVDGLNSVFGAGFNEPNPGPSPQAATRKECPSEQIRMATHVLHKKSLTQNICDVGKLGYGKTTVDRSLLNTSLCLY